MNSYDQYDKHYVALDCIILGFDNNELKLLVQKRRLKPLEGQWSLMGGFVKADEALNQAARRITQELTGLDNVYYEQVEVFGTINRDTEARVISICYYALIKIDDMDNEVISKHGAKWFPVTEIPKLVFDHNLMVVLALEKLREKCRIKPLGFELLPEKFTIPQLQALYEAILMKDLDKRNFRKKLLGMGLLDKFEEKDKAGSKKGAFLYSFNKNKYEFLTQKGGLFEL